MQLPKAAQQFTRVIGTDAVLRLAQTTDRIYIPVNTLKADHPLVRAIGPDLAAKAQRTFGGEYLKLKNVRKRTRDRSIAASWVKGTKASELAAHHHVCERTVLRALEHVTTNDLTGAAGPRDPNRRLTRTGGTPG